MNACSTVDTTGIGSGGSGQAPLAALVWLPHRQAPPNIAVQVECRRLPEEVARVTQTLQLDVEELFASLLDWDIGKPEAGPAAGGSGTTAAADQQQEQASHLQEQGESQQQQQRQQGHEDAQQQPDSKKLCGNVAADQPDLIGLDVWPASIALCRFLAATPALAAGASVCELGAGAPVRGCTCP